MKLTHFNKDGKAHMVDISDKEVTKRCAVATGKIRMNKEAMELLVNGSARKGDVLGVARIAGIMATKETARLIPMCHPLSISRVNIEFLVSEEDREVALKCTVECTGQTGVEMEAITGASVALLTIYDMLKAVDRSMLITDICLLKKEGGKSGLYERA